jgi:ABC-type oligopeptide transport system substrate-binding subunit
MGIQKWAFEMGIQNKNYEMGIQMWLASLMTPSSQYLIFSCSVQLIFLQHIFYLSGWTFSEDFFDLLG